MIYFIRHGETNYNTEHRIQGQLDIPLNSKGISQAEIMAEKLKDIAIDRIYSSPLRRTKQTATIINKYHNIEIVYDDRLKEFYGGHIQGRTYNDMTDEEKKRALDDPEYWHGESNESMKGRTIEFYKEIMDSSENILVVSHGGVWRHIHRYKNGIPDNEPVPAPPNCEILEI